LLQNKTLANITAGLVIRIPVEDTRNTISSRKVTTKAIAVVEIQDAETEEAVETLGAAMRVETNSRQETLMISPISMRINR
jgi:hypothetical protein